MGRITRSLARRRVLVGLIGLGALALAACTQPLKPQPEPEPPSLPNIEICAPVRAVPEAQVTAEPVPSECVPFCLPGEEPAPPPPAETSVEPLTDRECVPICEFLPPPDASAQAAQRCVSLPIPCLPGQETPREEFAQALRESLVRCVNFCLPGSEPQPPQEFAEAQREMCVPVCAFAEVIRGLPGLEPCPPTERGSRDPRGVYGSAGKP
jgi:hypothetical protein